MTEERFAYEGPRELLPTIVQALEKVVDPEVALNIVDVGLVYGVTVREGRMDVNITMTSAACPVTDIIVDDVENALDDALPPDLKIHVELVWEPPWTPQRMSPRARAFMGW
ncbi:metal-sulfur cluster assembly factor [Ramlibacter sp. G-1-2-2]|uniref:Metal-sulfur cluster assembly factor n=1 Tax=Ramlibacter agri TaxID=2728837 RepID=A0A848HDQ1_9BURK|nr:metal-sulfur cluster assembly factor [Ramlibacter agri]NML48604.1 metal-sulfur cluster assembly factor [Ramlibacter agri]